MLPHEERGGAGRVSSGRNNLARKGSVGGGNRPRVPRAGEPREIIVCPRPRVEYVLGTTAMPVPGAEFIEPHADRARPVAHPGLGLLGDRHEFVFESPATVVEGPRAIGDVHMPRILSGGRPQAHRHESARTRFQKGVRQNVAGTGGEEPLVGTAPGQVLVGTFQRSPPKDGTWNIHAPSVFHRYRTGSGQHRGPPTPGGSGRALVGSVGLT